MDSWEKRLPGSLLGKLIIFWRLDKEATLNNNYSFIIQFEKK
jgi:hypothetical protein